MVHLEPGYRQAYLALAVSYTNEGELEAAYQMLERWIQLGEGDVGIEEQSVHGTGRAEGRKQLVDRLIEMARRSPEMVDAEVQVALGVLFNLSEVSASSH